MERIKYVVQERKIGDDCWTNMRSVEVDTDDPESDAGAQAAAIHWAGDLNRALSRGSAIHRVWDQINEREVYRRGYHRKHGGRA